MLAILLRLKTKESFQNVLQPHFGATLIFIESSSVIAALTLILSVNGTLDMSKTKAIPVDFLHHFKKNSNFQYQVFFLLLT